MENLRGKDSISNKFLKKIPRDFWDTLIFRNIHGTSDLTENQNSGMYMLYQRLMHVVCFRHAAGNVNSRRRTCPRDALPRQSPRSVEKRNEIHYMRETTAVDWNGRRISWPEKPPQSHANTRAHTALIQLHRKI